jgi:hypothetical protein
MLIVDGIRWITAKEVAEIKGISPQMVSHLKSQGKINSKVFENLNKIELFNLDLMELSEQESKNAQTKFTTSQNIFTMSVSEFALFISKTFNDLSDFKNNADRIEAEQVAKIGEMTAKWQKAEEDLGKALDREDALRDSFDRYKKEFSEMQAELYRANEACSTLSSALQQAKNEYAHLETLQASTQESLTKAKHLNVEIQHDNEKKVLLINALQTEKAGLEKALGEKTALLTVEQETSKNYFEQVKSLKTELLKAQNTEKTAVFEKEKLEQQISFLQEKIENQAKNHAEQGKQFETLAKILEGNSRFTESFEIWFEKNPNNPSNMRPLVKTSLGYFLATGKSVNPENELVSLAEYPKILAGELLLEDLAIAKEDLAKITDSKEAPEGLKKQKGGAK